MINKQFLLELTKHCFLKVAYKYQLRAYIYQARSLLAGDTDTSLSGQCTAVLLTNPDEHLIDLIFFEKIPTVKWFF